MAGHGRWITRKLVASFRDEAVGSAELADKVRFSGLTDIWRARPEWVSVFMERAVRDGDAAGAQWLLTEQVLPHATFTKVLFWYQQLAARASVRQGPQGEIRGVLEAAAEGVTLDDNMVLLAIDGWMSRGDAASFAAFLEDMPHVLGLSVTSLHFERAYAARYLTLPTALAVLQVHARLLSTDSYFAPHGAVCAVRVVSEIAPALVLPFVRALPEEWRSAEVLRRACLRVDDAPQCAALHLLAQASPCWPAPAGAFAAKYFLLGDSAAARAVCDDLPEGSDARWDAYLCVLALVQSVDLCLLAAAQGDVSLADLALLYLLTTDAAGAAVYDQGPGDPASDASAAARYRAFAAEDPGEGLASFLRAAPHVAGGGLAAAAGRVFDSPAAALAAATPVHLQVYLNSVADVVLYAETVLDACTV